MSFYRVLSLFFPSLLQAVSGKRAGQVKKLDDSREKKA